MNKAIDKDSSDRPVKISVRNLNFYYGNHQALFDNNMDIYENQVTAVIGPSGYE